MRWRRSVTEFLPTTPNQETAVNDTTIRTYDKENKTEIRVYTSPMEFVKDGTAGGKANGDMTGPQTLGNWTSGRAASWDGYAAVFPTPNPAGRKLVEEYAKKIDSEIGEPESIRRRQRWLEDEGDVCLNRAFAGEDAIFRGPVRGKRVATKNIALVCNCTVSCTMDGNHVANTAAGIAAAVDKLEDAGYSVELWLVWHTHRTYGNGDRVFIACRAKECGEPLASDILASVCHTDFTRIACHGMTHTGGRTPNLGLGSIAEPESDLFKWIDLAQGVKPIHCGYQKNARLVNPLEQAKRIVREATET